LNIILYVSIKITETNRKTNCFVAFSKATITGSGYVRGVKVIVGWREIAAEPKFNKATIDSFSRR